MEMLSKLERAGPDFGPELKTEAYGTSIYTHIVGLTGQDATVSNVYFPLNAWCERLSPGLSGEPTPKRGGMGKRYYRITKSGLEALQENRAVNLAAWRGVAALIKHAEV